MHRNPYPHQDLSPDEYHRLREAAKQRALQLREEALRDIPGQAVRRAARWLNRLVGGHALHHGPCASARS